jgi:hypothetical protein
MARVHARQYNSPSQIPSPKMRSQYRLLLSRVTESHRGSQLAALERRQTEPSFH